MSAQPQLVADSSVAGSVTPIAPANIEPSPLIVMPDNSELLETQLKQDREPSGGSSEVKFEEAGRDYHRPQFETALISVLLNHPSLVSKVSRSLDAADFYLPQAYGVFEAILHVHTSGKLVSPSSVLWFLQQVEPANIAKWTEFVNSCAATASNHQHLAAYVEKLKEAAAIRGGKKHCPHKYRESFCAQLLIAGLPPTRCVDEAFYQYRAGVWSVADSNLLRAEALAVMPPAHRQSRRAAELLKQVEGQLQVASDIFRGAYFTNEGGCILINAANCVIEVAPDGSRRQLEHSRDFNFTLKLAANYDPSARCERFLQLLEEALPDARDREAFQCFGGYVLMPNCNLETVMVCFGPGGTGKSKATGVFRDVLGDDLCGASGLDELCKSASYSLPKLKHKMLNLGTELNGHEIEESANLKKLASGESMDVRQIYGKPEDMRTTCKMLFLSNIQPRFRAGTNAESRRLRIVPFTVERAENDKDIHLGEKLSKEARGILNWMLEGLTMILKTKLIPHGGDAAKLMMENFCKNNDPVGSFVGECCVFRKSESVVKRDLYNAFADWCEDVGLSSSKLENYFFKTLLQRYSNLKARRITTKDGRRHILEGIGIKPENPESSAAEGRPTIEPSKISVATQARINQMLEDAKKRIE